jgi:hypothetical protein
LSSRWQSGRLEVFQIAGCNRKGASEHAAENAFVILSHPAEGDSIATVIEYGIVAGGQIEPV